MRNRATIFDIQRSSFVDGPGLRTAVFFKGCNLRCAWCHNPEGIRPEPQVLYWPEKCARCGRCGNDFLSFAQKGGYCPSNARRLAGTSYSPEELLAIVSEDKPFYRSGGGVTCTGGECMLQSDFLEQFLPLCRAEGIDVAIDTAGCVPWARFESVLPDVNLFLYDFKCLTPETHRRFTGVDNALILENLRRLSECGARLWIRVPLIPECCGNPEELSRMGEFIGELRVEKIEVLPYHTLGLSKGQAAGIEMQRFTEPDDALIALAEEKLGARNSKGR